MVDRIRYPTVSYLPFVQIITFLGLSFDLYFFKILKRDINILATKDILSNLDGIANFCSLSLFCATGLGVDWRINTSDGINSNPLSLRIQSCQV